MTLHQSRRREWWYRANCASRWDSWPSGAESDLSRRGRSGSRGWSIRVRAVAEDPLRQLGRLAAGIVLMQGRLGHQVLGQLLLMDSSEIAMAGAALALAATSGPHNEVLQVA